VFPSEIGVTGEAPVWFQGDRAILHGTRDVKGRVSFYKLDLATGRQTPVTVKAGVRAVFALSGDGRTVYAGSREDGPPAAGIYAIDLQSGNEKLIYPWAPKGGERVRYYVGSMAMSPDGRTLACIVQAATPTGTNRELLLMNPDGSNVRTLLRTAGEGPGALFPSFGAVAWSPDSKDLYVVRLKEHRGSSNILEVHRLAPEPGSETTPTGIIASQIRFLSVDPTGNKIAFTTGAQLTSELWSLDNALTTLSAAR
jgi:dipeptidyl aminopeptidase/acylaminoacyl peptidase